MKLLSVLLLCGVLVSACGDHAYSCRHPSKHDDQVYQQSKRICDELKGQWCKCDDDHKGYDGHDGHKGFDDHDDKDGHDGKDGYDWKDGKDGHDDHKDGHDDHKDGHDDRDGHDGKDKRGWYCSLYGDNVKKFQDRCKWAGQDWYWAECYKKKF